MNKLAISSVSYKHRLAESNCTSPEPALTFLRYEPVKIGGRDYPAAVVQSRDEVVTMTAWHSMTPALGCMELKSIANYTSPGLGRGTTVHEPLSLTLTEPDSQLLDLQAKISAMAAVEVVPLSSWETTVKSKIKAYEAASAQK